MSISQVGPAKVEGIRREWLNEVAVFDAAKEMMRQGLRPWVVNVGRIFQYRILVNGLECVVVARDRVDKPWRKFSTHVNDAHAMIGVDYTTSSPSFHVVRVDKPMGAKWDGDTRGRWDYLF